jgi:hypothetical protein
VGFTATAGLWLQLQGEKRGDGRRKIDDGQETVDDERKKGE